MTGILFLVLYSNLAKAFELNLATVNICSWGEASEQRLRAIHEKIQSEYLSRTYPQKNIILGQEIVYSEVKNELQNLLSAFHYDLFYTEAHLGEGLGIFFSSALNVKNESLNIASRYSQSDYSRVALSSRFSIDGLSVRVLNTHLAHEPKYADTRKAQLREILQWLEREESEKASDLIVLGGDFNTGYNEAYYSGEFSLLTDSLFKFKLPEKSSRENTWVDFSNNHGEKVDYFFVSQSNSKFRSEEKLVDLTSTRLSDHNALILQMRSE